MLNKNNNKLRVVLQNQAVREQIEWIRDCFEMPTMSKTITFITLKFLDQQSEIKRLQRELSLLKLKKQ